jgi:hypothetical protein
MDFAIDHGVPIPERNSYQRRHKPRVTYGWDRLDVGDSILIADTDSSFFARARSAQISAHLYGVRNGRQFTHRSVPGGCRVWRTA